MRYQISDRIAGMRSHRVRFVQISQRVAVRIGFPTYLFEILDEVLTALIYQHPMLSSVVSQQRVHAVDAILHRRIGTRYTNLGVIAIGVAAEKLLYDLPVRARGRRPALFSRRVAINVDIKRDPRVPLLGSAEQLFACRQRI